MAKFLLGTFIACYSVFAFADMNFGGAAAIAGCLDPATGQINNQPCIQPQQYNTSAPVYTGQDQPLAISVTATATASEAPGQNFIAEHVNLAVTLQDPSNFFYVSSQIVTLARVHVCTNVKDCADSMEVRDLPLSLNRDAGQKSLSGEIQTDLTFDSGSNLEQLIESVDILVPGVMQVVTVGK